jgi:hypothetical protein
MQPNQRRFSECMPARRIEVCRSLQPKISVIYFLPIVGLFPPQPGGLSTGDCTHVNRINARHCGLLQIGAPSPSSQFRQSESEIADSLWWIFEIFPFSGDSDRRPGSIRTAWRALESWEPATRAAAREIACQQPAESSGGRGSRGGMIVGPWRISQVVLFKLFARTAERREGLF